MQCAILGPVLGPEERTGSHRKPGSHGTDVLLGLSTVLPQGYKMWERTVPWSDCWEGCQSYRE